MRMAAKIDSTLLKVYEDTNLKDKLVAGAFVCLVLPTALALSLGVPERLAYSGMLVMIFPVLLMLAAKFDSKNKALLPKTIGKSPAPANLQMGTSSLRK